MLDLNKYLLYFFLPIFKIEAASYFQILIA